MQALHTAATGMAAQELNVQVISNNIANLLQQQSDLHKSAIEKLADVPA